MDTLIITTIAVVICVVIGLPVGIMMARRKGVSASVTPVLDVMQTMPAFAYLTPLALIFGIGPAAAIVVTVIYSVPPLVRITEHGIRSVSPGAIEAAESLGVSRGQLLRQVQIPMARRTIIVGVNQCTMAALSMATIAVLVNGPGLGKPVQAALQNLDVGTAAVAGLRDRARRDHARPRHHRGQRAGGQGDQVGRPGERQAAAPDRAGAAGARRGPGLPLASVPEPRDLPEGCEHRDRPGFEGRLGHRLVRRTRSRAPPTRSRTPSATASSTRCSRCSRRRRGGSWRRSSSRWRSSSVAGVRPW